MKVLIAGGAGYIGGYLTDLLVAKGFDVTVYDSLIYEDRFLKKVNFVNGDIRDKRKLSTLLPQYDAVVWLAAIVGDGACAVDPFLTCSINEDPVKWLVDNYQGKIVFTSTCSIYGVNNDLIDETASPNPLSVYASTKLAAEQYIVQNKSDALVFRLGTLYGLGDEHSRVRFDLVVNILSQRAAMGEELRVFGGEQWRPLLHVKDVGEAICYGLESNKSGLFNLHDRNMRIKDIADEIASLFADTKVKYQDIKFEDARNYRVTSDKFRKEGWLPNHTIQEGIAEICSAIKQGRIKDVRNEVYSNEAYLKGIRTHQWAPKEY